MNVIAVDRVGLIVPTYNAGVIWNQWISLFSQQTIKPKHTLIIDSSSSDQTAVLARASGFRVQVIPSAQFDHGGTRQNACEFLSECDYWVFMTQDSLLADGRAIEQLLYCFANPQVGAAYGRQLPRKGAGPIEAHARLFNYPNEGQVKSVADADKLGIKTAFISNSFAAYRRSALTEVGGFPLKSILSEDTYVASKMLLAGWEIDYCADAKVFHSHDYSPLQEFKRYFDQGVFHARNSWIRKAFGQAEGEGMRFIHSELKFLFPKHPFLIPSAIFRNVLKFIGYKLGLIEEKIPVWFKLRLTMHKKFWLNGGKTG